jgi:S-(hydroxymethyl)glutathione synthase
MRRLETSIVIDAPAQTVWAILDELTNYPEWNPMLPDLRGRTTVGSQLTSTFVRPNTPTMTISPRITRIVAGRELRWLTQAPDPTLFSAEHIFRLSPQRSGRTVFHNDEVFEGSLVEERWPGLDTNTRLAYEDVNRRLKDRAEAKARERPGVHPVTAARVDQSTGLARATLRCKCSDPVEVQLNEEISHNHLCGCSQCWKPEGYFMAQTAVVPAGSTQVTRNADRLSVVDSTQKVQRYACTSCGVHMVGRVEDPDHHFFGLEFVHPELAVDRVAPAPEFAGFVSSLINSGLSPTLIAAVRHSLREVGIPAYDTFSPEIMDLVAWHQLKIKKQP